MRKILVAASSVAVISLFGAASVSAQDFSANPGTYVAEGYLALFQTIPNISCYVVMDVSVDKGGKAKTTNVVFSQGANGSPLCGVAIFPTTTNWDFVKLSSTVNTGQFALNNVNVQAGAGTCSGTLTPLTLSWGGTNQIVATTAIVPGSPAICQVSGVLNVTQTSGATGPFRMP